jgi:hypothetical protein
MSTNRDADADARTAEGSASPVAGPPTRFTPAHRIALDAHRADQDRTVTALHDLEQALSAAGPGREQRWRAEVVAALDVLAEATAEEDGNAGQPESLLSDIARTQPRLRTRVRGLRAQYRQLREAVDRFRVELTEPDPDADFVLDVADVRRRLDWLLGALRHQRARESDLIYEAYYEAFRRDVEEDAGSPLDAAG